MGNLAARLGDTDAVHGVAEGFAVVFRPGRRDERTGLVCPPQDRAALARTVIRFYDEGWEDRLVQGIAEERTKYSWDRMAEAVERMLLAAEPAETRKGNAP